VYNNQQLSQFKKQLLALQKILIEDNLSGESATQIVELDQSSVGRLSRMDAMQGQAMAQENERRRILKLGLIDAALKRITNNDYGVCLSCDEDIAIKRLEFDPASTLCIECANLKENQ
jgi:DnaK suppressor protein